VNRRKPFILIVGPTASGKSAVALALARKFGAAILNCDSLQVYRRLDIGTAKPSAGERASLPHFLFDVADPGEILTAGDFRRLALEVLQRELPNHPVIGVGGSGFYIQALEKGMFDVAKPRPEVDARVRRQVDERGLAWAHGELQRLDPVYAEQLNPNDAYRITRALVMIEDSGEAVSRVRERFQAAAFPYPLLKLGLNPGREELLPRVRARTRSMLDEGLLDEVRALLADGFAAWPPLRSVGYKECLAHLSGELAAEDLAETIVQKTMQLAKKQKTWFKRDPVTHWLNSDDAVEEAAGQVSRFLDRLE
jgi:tRNA dimethylallyltransferase